MGWGRENTYRLDDLASKDVDPQLPRRESAQYSPIPPEDPEQLAVAISEMATSLNRAGRNGEVRVQTVDSPNSEREDLYIVLRRHLQSLEGRKSEPLAT